MNEYWLDSSDVETFKEWLIYHEHDIALAINDFGELKGIFEQFLDRRPTSDSTPAGVPDYALDALDNLVHDNYERSSCGARNRAADAELIKAAILNAHPTSDTDPDEYEEVGEQYLVRNGFGIEFWHDKPYYNGSRCIETRKIYAKREKEQNHE